VRDVERILEESGLDALLVETNTIYEDIINAIFLSLLFSGRIEAGRLSSKLALKISLNESDVAITNFMSRETTRISSAFIEKQREATTEALLDGMRRGNTNEQQANALIASIGLTLSQVKAINNYRDTLEKKPLAALNRKLRDKSFDAAVISAAKRKVEIDQTKIDAMVARYAEKQLQNRAEVIAQNEASKAIQEGAHIAVGQSLAAGLLLVSEIVRTWITRRDGKVRTSHSTMHGQKRGYNDVFISGNGNALRFPHDSSAPLSETIHCRCVLIIDY
jgi:hypothetical protein